MAVAMELVTRTLEECERVIERGLTTFVEVGQALMEIRDGRLYREQGYGTFEDYCQKRWGWSRDYAYKTMRSAEVVQVLRADVDHGLQIPSTERQARELVPLLRQDETAVVEVWRELKEQHGDKITAEKVREAVNVKLAGIVREAVELGWQAGVDITTESIKQSTHVSYNSGNNEWYTPAEYIEAARQVMSEIDLDPASSEIANRLVKARTYYTAENDGLLYSWHGRTWMNPPYAAELIGKFTEKLAYHYREFDVPEAIVLVNNATETNWFQGLLIYASAVCFVKQRVKFIDIEGNPTGAPLQGQAVLYLGDNPKRFGAEFTPFGTVLYGRRAAWCDQE